MINQPVSLDPGISNGKSTAAPYVSSHLHTTLFERFLLFITPVLLPLQEQVPTVAGMSVMFLMFAVLSAYVILNRPRTLGKTWYHPIFIATYAFIGVSVLMEFSSPQSRYEEIFRFGQMTAGMVCVAVLCRDRSALTAGLYGCIAAALWVSLVLYLTSYGTLQGMQADSFHEASKARNQAFQDKAIEGNINGLAHACSQGAIIAFAMTLLERSRHRRNLLLGITAFCLVSSFLPMSRGAAVISLVSFAVILYTYGSKHGKVMLLLAVLGLGIYTIVPDAVWSRMAFSTESRSGKLEGRAWIYTTALNRLPEYVVAGVGSGNFHKKWGFEKGFAREHGGELAVYGAHNAFLQIAIFWGVLGLLAFLLIMWCVYRSFPSRSARDGLSLALVGVVVSLGLQLSQSHVFSDKWYAIGIGLLIGARQWIWPTGIVSAVEDKYPSRAQLRPD